MNAVRDEIAQRRELYSPAEHLRVPPHSVESEQAVLGGLMLDPSAWPLVSDVLTEADFYRRDHALIWRAIAELAGKGKPYDAVTMGDWFADQELGEQVAGGAYLIELASNTPSAANIAAYAEILLDRSGKRRLIELGTGIVNDAFQPQGREFSELIGDVSRQVGELQPVQKGGLRNLGGSMKGWWEQFSERFDSGECMTGLPTPWHDFNEVTHGLQPSTLYLFAARPSMGKSIAGLQLAMFTALRGRTVGVFSLEMSRGDCTNRMVAALADVPHDFIVAPDKRHEQAEAYVSRMTGPIRDLKTAPLFIDDTADLTERQFEARARRMHMRHPLDLIVVDHIHDFRVDPKLARFEYGRIVQVGKSLAKEFRIPVILVAQLNRRVANASERRPTLTDLRESGELEQKADVVVLLHREDYYDTPGNETHLKGVVEMHFAKGRNIQAGRRINLRNRFDVMRMDDWEGEFPRAPEPVRKQSRGFGRNQEAF